MLLLKKSVFPTRVGVFLFLASLVVPSLCLPHACGGVSTKLSLATLSPVSSPRVWGCFLGFIVCVQPKIVFPTRVGVFPVKGFNRHDQFRLPHACGGVSHNGS